MREEQDISAADCPSRTELEELIAGRLAFDQHAAVERHIESCAVCQADLVMLDQQQDEFITTVHDTLNLAEMCTERPYRRLLDRLLSMGHGVSYEAGHAHVPAAASIVGRELGDFRIIAEVGRGGMGIVYQAEQLSLRRLVALKILPDHGLVSERCVQRFENEARAAAKLAHAHIVSVYQVGIEQGVRYIAMQLIDGINLAEFLEAKRGGRQSHDLARAGSILADLVSRPALAGAAHIDSVVQMGIQAAQALDYAREQGIVHRDIKPSNLMLDQNGKLWMTDFGLARIEADPTLSQTGAVLGTLRYMSPEQARDRESVDHRSDIYSLGATLYELLTLTPVFAGTAPELLRARIFDDEPQPPRQLNFQIPVDLETIVLKAISKNAAERYATAGAFAADLTRYRQGEPIHARAAGPVRRALKLARRRPAATAVFATCALGIVAFMIAGWWHATRLESALMATDRMRIVADEQRQAAFEQGALVQKHALRERQLWYAADMKQAFAAFKNNHIGETLDLLARHEPQPGEEDLRSFAWHYLDRLCHADKQTLRGHVSDVHSVAFSPDGLRLATASHDGTAKLWDLANGSVLATFLEGHTDQLNAIAYSPDGCTIATGSDDHYVRLWDVASGQERAALLGHSDDVNSLAFSPDGTLLASGGADRIIKLWDPATGGELATLTDHRGGVESLAFSPDGATLASASGDRTAILWDIAKRSPRLTLKGHDDVLRTVAFANSGLIVATGSEDRTVKLWNAETGHLQATLPGHGEVIRRAVFSHDDATLAVVVQDGSVWMYDTATNQVRHTLRGHTGRIWHAAFSPDGRSLATASGDGTAKIWSALTDPTHTALTDVPIPIEEVMFSSDGRHLTATNYRNYLAFFVWDLAANGTPARLRGDYPAPREDGVAPAGATRVFAIQNVTTNVSDAVVLAHADEGRWQVCTLHPAPELRPLRFTCLALSPGAKLWAGGMDDGMTLLWEVATGCESNRLGAPGGSRINSLTFDHSGGRLAVCANDGICQVWDTATATRRFDLRGHNGNVNQAAFSPNGSILATASGDRTVRLWDMSTGAEQARLPGHAGRVLSVAFSPDGKTVASGGDDRTVRLWDVATARELFTLEGHHGLVQSVVFSPDGKYLASGCEVPDGNGHGELFVWPALSPQVE